MREPATNIKLETTDEETPEKRNQNDKTPPYL